MRTLALIAAVAAVFAACSESDAGPAPTPVPTASPASPDDSGAARTTSIPTTLPAAPLTVTVELDVPASGFASEVTIGVDADGSPIDPFGVYASCSGHHTFVSSYSVLVSNPDAAFRSFSVITDQAVDGPGVHDASMRLEPLVAQPVDAVGTLTIDEGMRSGSFVGFDPTGSALTGSFGCEGGDQSPEPLEIGADDGRLDTVEVVALLRDGAAERVVVLAADADEFDAECAAAAGGSSPTVVRVDGDLTAGGITTFEITAGADPTLRLRVRDGLYEVPDVDIDLADPPTSGAFSGVTDAGVTIDGAFRCT